MPTFPMENIFIKLYFSGGEDIAQCLKALTALAKDLGSVPGAHI